MLKYIHSSAYIKTYKSKPDSQTQHGVRSGIQINQDDSINSSGIYYHRQSSNLTIYKSAILKLRMYKFYPPDLLTFDGNIKEHWERWKQETELYFLVT